MRTCKTFKKLIVGELTGSVNLDAEECANISKWMSDIQCENELLISENTQLKQSNELYVKDNGSMADEAIAYKERAEKANAKIANLHMIITKQTERIKRQAARITELEALYAGTKRSKKAATIKAKYKALKAREHTVGIWYGWLR